MAGESFRRLLEQAIALDANYRPAWSAAGSHPLGAGIKKGRELPHPSRGRIKLPADGPALEALRAAVSSAPPPIELEFHDQAWGGLLDMPPFRVDLESGDGSELLARGVPASGEASNYVAFAQAAVFRSSTERLSDGVLDTARFAGSAVLTLRLEGRTRVIEDAWLQVQWHTSTFDLLRHFEEFWPLYRAGNREKGLKRLNLLLHRAHEAQLSPEAVRAVDATARILGFRVSVLNRQTVDGGRLERELVDGGSALIAVGDVDDETRALAGRFQATGPSRQVRYLPVLNLDVVGRLRSMIVDLARVGGGLHAVEEPVVDLDSIPPMPIEPIDCRHLGDLTYVRDARSGFWWTKDFAHHAEVPFKTYELVGGWFEWEADRHENGEVYSRKHKGDVLRRFRESGTHRCANFSKHI